MKAVILVSGPSRGTRFRPLSLSVPKPLFPLAGEEMISHHINALAKIPVEEIFLLGYYKQEMNDFIIKTNTRNQSKGIKIR